MTRIVPHLLLVAVVTVLALAVVNAGEPASGTTQARVTHSRHVLRFFRTHEWLVAPRRERCSSVPWTRSCLIGRERVRFHQRRLDRWEASLIPRGEHELRAYIADDCLEEIIDRETAGTWNPQVYNYQGSGAYGLPQALPGHKMASAGADWRTNPKTQIRWARSYANGRYGSTCGALAHHNAYGWW